MGNEAGSSSVSVEGTVNTGKCNRGLTDMGKEAGSCLVSVEENGLPKTKVVQNVEVMKMKTYKWPGFCFFLF